MSLIDHGAIHELVGQVLTTRALRFRHESEVSMMGCSAVLVDALRDAERNCSGDSRQGLQTTWWEPSKRSLTRPWRTESRSSQHRPRAKPCAPSLAMQQTLENAESFANLRVSLFDYALEMPMDQLASEADKLNPEEPVDIVISTVRSILDDPSLSRVPRNESRKSSRKQAT